MSDELNTFPEDARAFLRDLSANNTRDWFNEHKARYEAELKHPALALLDIVGADIERMTGARATTKLFRPQRDVRFSKDKTPYHTHLHMSWSTGRAGGTGWFLGIAPEYVSAGAGAFGFDKAALGRWREAVAGPDGAHWAELVAQASRKGARLNVPALKRVPSAYGKDHAQADLLRRKGLAFWFDADEAQLKKDGLIAWIRTVFSELLPVQNALRPLIM